MNLYGNQLGYINGLRLIDNELVGDPYEDWSRVRSPGRARRRRKQGHPQRIVTRYRANGKALHDVNMNCIYVHPHDRIKIERMMRDRP